MTVRFENYTHAFRKKGKPVFAPSDLGRRIGEDVKERVERAVRFDSFFYHLRYGGHVAALHIHRPNRFFARLDIDRFFYSIGRNRVVHALRTANIVRPEHYGKWSCVKNPYEVPSYALPYGFVQSPILASLVLMHSPTGVLLRRLTQDVTVSVYMDDISISANDEEVLHATYSALLDAIAASGFSANEAKLRPPAETIDLFNCELKQAETRVSEERVNTFRRVSHSPAGEIGFARYCQSVERGNGCEGFKANRQATT